VLLDPAAPGKSAALTVVRRGAARGDSVRTERWRHTRWSDGSEELYDHDVDPLEWNNLDVDPRFAAVKSELARELPAIVRPDDVTGRATEPKAKSKK
jgi:hypothetical protein